MYERRRNREKAWCRLIDKNPLYMHHQPEDDVKNSRISGALALGRNNRGASWQCIVEMRDHASAFAPWRRAFVAVAWQLACGMLLLGGINIARQLLPAS